MEYRANRKAARGQWLAKPAAAAYSHGMGTRDRSRDEGPLLAVVPNVPAHREADGRAFLDIKAMDGLALYAALWPGPVRCIFREGPRAAIGYGRSHSPDQLPFEVVLVPANADAATVAGAAAGAALLLGGADSHLDFSLPAALAPVPAVMAIEYTLRTRLQIVAGGGGTALARLKSAAWLLLAERRRRACLRAAAGIQANGAGAFAAYRGLGPAPLLFFDTRLREADAITADAIEAKVAALHEQQPLRLAFSGRLERMKGADRLVPVLAELARSGVNATLDIFGDGTLRPAIAAQAQAAGVADRVRLRGPVAFEAELVPAMQAEVDLFLCLHPQGDPSCTYLETLGCGVPIAGFLNEAFRGVLALGPCGVGVAVDDVRGLARAIARLDQDRAALAALTRGAARVAAGRGFEAVFKARVDHLIRIAG